MSKNPSGTLRFLPLGLNVQGKHCLVVGGGRVGTRKALTLMRAAAAVTVLAPTVTAELTEEIQARHVQWLQQRFSREHLEGVFLVVAATDDDAVNEAVVRAAEQSGVLVCDASSAQRSAVTFGALLQGDGFTVAVFTGGCEPARARQARDRIAGFLGGDRRSRSES